MRTNDKRKSLLTAVYCLAAAAALITVCSRSSFLYVFNIWDDVNSYMTVGKSMFRGLVPYRDLFDQKGIMLYFIYGIASLFSATTFRAVYVLEVAAAFAVLFAMYKIYGLFFEHELTALLPVPVCGALIYSAWCFYWGGSAEEFLLPFLMWGMYLSLRYFRYGLRSEDGSAQPMSDRDIFTAGILAGCVFHIKFSSLGFYFGFMLMIVLTDLLAVKSIVKACRHILLFLAGFAAATLPWVIYFAVNGAVGDWIYVYIYKNVFEYSEKLAFAERLQRIYRILIDHWLNNKAVFVPAAAGFVFLAVCAVVTALGRRRKNEDREAGGQDKSFFLRISVPEYLNIFALFFFLTAVIFIGGVSLPYYVLPVTLSVTVAGLALGHVCEWIASAIRERAVERDKGAEKGRSAVSRAAGPVCLAIAVAAGVAFCLTTSVNPPFMSVGEDDLWLFRFRDRIVADGVTEPKLLNVNCFDAGLYTVTDTVPVCYYFQTQTLNQGEVMGVQNDMIKREIPDYILARDYPLSIEGPGYELIMTDSVDLPRFEHLYYLYGRKK